MLYFIGFVLFLVWILSLPFRWPVLLIELIVGWLVGAAGFLLFDRQWPAFDRRENLIRSVWFGIIVLIGLSLAFYKIAR